MKKLSAKNKARLRRAAEQAVAKLEPTVELPADDEAFVSAVLAVAEERSAKKGAARARKQKGR
jgi:hypothetical protein